MFFALDNHRTEGGCALLMYCKAILQSHVKSFSIISVLRCTSKSLTCTSYPTYTSVLLRAIEWWYHDPNVSTPVLKLMAELVQNRSQRLHFDVSSPNGILLFRVTSEMIVAYGTAYCINADLLCVLLAYCFSGTMSLDRREETGHFPYANEQTNKQNSVFHSQVSRGSKTTRKNTWRNLEQH